MRFISSTTIKRLLALTLACVLLCPAALATTMDDTLTLGMISVKSQHLNPLLSEEREFQSLTALIFEGLFSLDDDYKPVPCLAESWTAEGSTWLITMRSDVTFHDGTPCTAYDAEATINEILRLAGEGQGQYAQLKYIVTSASANDAKTLRLKVSRPYYGVLYALTFPVLPKDQVQSVQPAGTGPYRVDSFAPTNYLYLSANEEWWQEPSTVKNINVIFRATNRELLSDYEYNRVDAAISRSASAGQYRTGLSNLNITYRTRQLEALMLNFREYPLDNADVRRAIRYAIDVDSVASTVYMGMASRTDTPLPAGTWMYQDDEEAFEYNPEKAKQILADLGWADADGDGVLDTVVDGKKRRLRLRIAVYEEQDNSVRVQAANMIAAMLEAIGIEAPVETWSFSYASERLKARNFDICLAAFQMDVVPDPGFLLMSGNTCNYGNYKSTEMDNLFKQLRQSMDPVDYEHCLHEIQKLYAKDCPFICLYYRNGALLTRKVFTVARDVREPEILRGIESIGK